MDTFKILPTDNIAGSKGFAIFTKFYLQEVISGNSFPAKTNLGEPYYFYGATIIDGHNDEVIIGNMGGTSNLNQAISEMIKFDENK